MGIAQSYDQKEEFAEANRYYDICINIWERFIGKGQSLLDGSNLATAYMNRGSNYYVMGENDKALSDHNKCVSILERLKSQGIPRDILDECYAYRNRALAFIALRNYTAGVNDYITAIRILKEEFSKEPGVQELYYDTLNRLIDLVKFVKNDRLLGNILQEYLYSMRSIPKTEEAEEAQNNILKGLGFGK